MTTEPTGLTLWEPDRTRPVETVKLPLQGVEWAKAMKALEIFRQHEAEGVPLCGMMSAMDFLEGVRCENY